MKTKKQRKEELFKQGLKKCPKCDEPKPLSEFSKDKHTLNGLMVYCKSHIKEYRDNNKEKTQEYRDKPENKVKQKKYDKKYQSNLENKIRRARNARKRYLKNKTKINECQRIRKQTDIRFKITSNLRTRVWFALSGNNKSLNTMFLVGCDIDYLMYHIQNQFTEGMSWDNHNIYGWHIDHIKPCSKFDLTKKSEQLKCFNYTNLQPLWAEENWRKK